MRSFVDTVIPAMVCSSSAILALSASFAVFTRSFQFSILAASSRCFVSATSSCCFSASVSFCSAIELSPRPVLVLVLGAAGVAGIWRMETSACLALSFQNDTFPSNSRYRPSEAESCS